LCRMPDDQPDHPLVMTARLLVHVCATLNIAIRTDFLEVVMPLYLWYAATVHALNKHVFGAVTPVEGM
jgi:hypothetical protein